MKADTAVWVESTPTRDGYVCTVHHSADASMSFTFDEATAYALALVRQTIYARQDAAVCAQLTDVVSKHQSKEFVDQTIAVVLKAIREARPDAAGVTFGPVHFLGILSARNRQAYVTATMNGKHITQWPPELVLQHAMHVLEVAVGVQLDGHYRTALVDVVGTTPRIARNMVNDLGDYRPDMEGRPDDD